MKIDTGFTVWLCSSLFFALVADCAGCEITIVSGFLIGVGAIGLVYTINWRIDKWARE